MRISDWSSDVRSSDLLLAGGDLDVVFAGVVQPRDFAAPFDELVGGTGHRRHHHRNLVAGVDLALDAPGHVLDTLDVTDRGAAEFHHDARPRGIRVPAIGGTAAAGRGLPAAGGPIPLTPNSEERRGGTEVVSTFK